MDRVLLYVGLSYVAFLLVMLGTFKTIRQYNVLKKNYEQLKNEVKLLQQENFYLKQLLNRDTDSVK